MKYKIIYDKDSFDNKKNAPCTVDSARDVLKNKLCENQDNKLWQVFTF